MQGNDATIWKKVLCTPVEKNKFWKTLSFIYGYVLFILQNFLFNFIVTVFTFKHKFHSRSSNKFKAIYSNFPCFYFNQFQILFFEIFEKEIHILTFHVQTVPF